MTSAYTIKCDPFIHENEWSEHKQPALETLYTLWTQQVIFRRIEVHTKTYTPSKSIDLQKEVMKQREKRKEETVVIKI